MSDEDVKYWASQVRGALEELGVDEHVTERYNADDVVITTNSDTTREERADLIHDLERRGFTVKSTTTDRYVTVDAPSDRLPHEFVEVA